MKKFINKIVKKFKKIWKNNCLNIIVPLASLVLFVIILIVFNVKKALILLVFINLVYFLIAFIRKKKKPSKKSKKKKWKKVLKIFLIIVLTLFIMGVMSVIAFFIYIVYNAPEFNEENLYVSAPSIVLDKDGNEIAKLGAEKRVIIGYDELPEVLIDAIIATEDSNFFEHRGVDWPRFIKASIYQVLGRSEAGGASTLTMQVSKNAYTSTNDEGIQGIIRKFTDLYVSMFVIEKNYTKEQIMEFYVNSQWLAKHTYGVEQTALTYFGKSAKDLNLSEAAMIAGLFQAPGRYDPYKNPEATETRRITVLKLMLRHGYISKEEFKIAKKLTVDKLILSKEESSYASGELSKYQSFIDAVADEVKDKTGKNPYNTSMTIYTTLDTNFQDYLNGIMNGETFNWENDKVQAGVAVVNVKDGSVAAIGGGRNVSIIDSYNLATETTNQIGSTAKPLYDYGPAIEYHNYSTYNPVVDEPISYSNGRSIGNWDGKYEGFETVRVALRGSRNIPALKTFKQNNKAQVIEFVTNLGLTPEIYSCDSGYYRKKNLCINKENPNDIVEAHKDSTLHEAHSIGGYNGESPLSMAAAYAAFGNGGVYTTPYTFTKLIFNDTGEEYINDVKKTKAMSEETAYMISDMLQTTAPYALGGYYNINGIRYAAKTGTTNFDDKTMKDHNFPYYAVNDLWVIGYNTEYAIGVWYGYETISDDYYNSFNSGQHSRLFQAVGRKVFTNGSSFTKPSGVIPVEVESGAPEAMLPSEFTPSDLRQTELFLRGTEPTTVSPRFAKLSDVSNLKSTTSGNKITLTWDKVKYPEVNTEEYIRAQFRKLFSNDDYFNSFISDRLAYIQNYIGTLEYDIYTKDEEDNLTLVGHTSANTYEIEIEESGEYTYIVKTTYSIFKDNMSDGKTIKVNITVTSPIIPNPGNNNNDDNDENNNTNNNDNNSGNNNNQQDNNSGDENNTP